MHLSLLAGVFASALPLSMAAHTVASHAVTDILASSHHSAQAVPANIQVASNALTTTSNDSLKAHAKQKEQRLGTATVVGNSVTHELKYAPQTVSLVSARQLQGTASSLNEVLNRVAGITIRSTGGVGSSSRISVRGLEGKRMGLFVNEAAIGQFSNFVNLDDIPTDMIERVEIYKGIVPYRLGGSALGGAVNVVTKEYPPHYLDASYEYGSFNTHRFNTVFKRNHAPSGLEFGIGGLYVHSDNNYEMTLHHLNDLKVRRNHDNFDKVVA